MVSWRDFPYSKFCLSLCYNDPCNTDGQRMVLKKGGGYSQYTQDKVFIVEYFFLSGGGDGYLCLL